MDVNNVLQFQFFFFFLFQAYCFECEMSVDYCVSHHIVCILVLILHNPEPFLILQWQAVFTRTTQKPSNNRVMQTSSTSSP